MSGRRQVDQVRLANVEVADQALAGAHGLDWVVTGHVDAAGVQVQAESGRVHSNDEIGRLAPSRREVAAVGLRERFDAEPGIVSGADPSLRRGRSRPRG